MPQASDELRAKFPGSDQEALEVLSANFIETKFVFRKKDAAYVPTRREWEAIDYLFHEWDFGYEELQESLCQECFHSYAQHTKGAHPNKYCRHCPCSWWVEYKEKA